ncbi:MAG: hypothetical protein KatS3mg095_0666 [Candidatus Parcubacteria bacterium]|nr:MAG: hypothetical protein KatS3mg095_0666 [Candidatus Parcubacteria bacterium]
MKIKVFYFLFLILFFIINGKAKAQALECNFNRNLFLGYRGQDVACLQSYLKEKGFFNYVVNGIYDSKTKRAVKKWQELNNIYPANGNFTISSIIFFKKNYYQNQEARNFLNKITEKDIILDEVNGLSRFDDYYQKVFIEISPNISSTTFNKFFRVDEPFSLVYLIDKTIQSSSSIDIQFVKEKNKIFKDFFEYRINRLKKIKIKSNLKDFHLAILLNDFLSLDLSSKFDDYLNNRISVDQLKSNLENFNLQLELIRKKYVNQFFGQVNNNNLITKFFNFLSDNKIFNFFFLKKAKAFNGGGIPFGGRIINIVLCPCSFGRLIFIGPPLPPAIGSIYAPFGIETTPTVFLWKNLYVPGVWLLGLYLPSSIPCLQFGFLSCFPIGFGSTILMVGTSLTP